MFRLPHALLPLDVAEQYCVDESVGAWTSGKHVIFDLCSDDEDGDWVEGAEDALSAIVGVRAELAAGDLRPLYVAWLSAYGAWERDEDALDDDHEDALEPPVPARLGSLSAPQRTLADFLRLDPDLLTVAAQASPPLPRPKTDTTELAAWIAALSPKDKDNLLVRVAQDEAAQVRIELLRCFHGTPSPPASDHPRRKVAELLDTAAELRQ